MKRSFFQAVVTSILLYGCTTWTLTKRLEKKLDGNYTRMLRAILNKSWQQHPTRHQLYGHLPPITKTIQVRRTRHAGHCWRSRDELIRDVLLWIPTHGRAKAGRPARTYIQQLCEDTGCCPEDLPRAMNDREEWRERVRDIRAASTIWWWWWYIYICVCVCMCVCVSEWVSVFQIKWYSLRGSLLDKCIALENYQTLLMLCLCYWNLIFSFTDFENSFFINYRKLYDYIICLNFFCCLLPSFGMSAMIPPTTKKKVTDDSDWSWYFSTWRWLSRSERDLEVPSSHDLASS